MEDGPMHILNYINYIQNDGFYGGELEISVAAELYNINIAKYREILNDKNEIIGYRYINYYNHNDNNENRHLMILTNIDNNHFRPAYDSYKNIDMQFNIANELSINQDNTKKNKDVEDLELNIDSETSKIKQKIKQKNL